MKVHILGTLAGSLFIDRKIMMSITDFYSNNIQENDLFEIVTSIYYA